MNVYCKQNVIQSILKNTQMPKICILFIHNVKIPVKDSTNEKNKIVMFDWWILIWVNCVNEVPVTLHLADEEIINGM